MLIGDAWRRQRPRNDLDDYLAEVDDHLFCVSRADRRCLHRDLKAHVREVTEDPRTAGEYGGRYLITREQLEEAIGRPEDIARMYISSVVKVPSVGMRTFLALVAAFMGVLLVLGIRQLDIPTVLAGQRTLDLYSEGGRYILAGALGMAAAVVLQIRPRRLMAMVPFLCLYILAVSRPILNFLAHTVARSTEIETNFASFLFYYQIFFAELLALAVVGLFLGINHLWVFRRRPETIV